MAYVYSYKLYDEVTDDFETQPFKATLEEIQRQVGLPIMRTKEFIPDYAVIDGRYHLLAA
ncbi:hypothetical protein [Methyloradius palustris]|uniref:Uncharacterized protein n=1 Tax=Methyloradius palustris TaxID=2778876 RepID=A0A8D5JQA2_9PROT|nr:hypothetical protein [Methyloradius palustris]BCM24296.1 hypothetical protein ZMTM_05550 [Methyloradius palustris]